MNAKTLLAHHNACVNLAHDLSNSSKRLDALIALIRLQGHGCTLPPAVTAAVAKVRRRPCMLTQSRHSYFSLRVRACDCEQVGFRERSDMRVLAYQLVRHCPHSHTSAWAMCAKAALEDMCTGATPSITACAMATLNRLPASALLALVWSKSLGDRLSPALELPDPHMRALSVRAVGTVGACVCRGSCTCVLTDAAQLLLRAWMALSDGAVQERVVATVGGEEGEGEGAEGEEGGAVATSDRRRRQEAQDRVGDVWRRVVGACQDDSDVVAGAGFGAIAGG